MIGVVVSGVRQIDNRWSMTTQVRCQTRGALRDLFLAPPVRQVEEVCFSAEDPCSGGRFSLSDPDRLGGRQRLESQFAGSKEGDGDTVTALGVQKHRAAAADGFIVGMGGDHQDVHAGSLDRRRADSSRRGDA